MTVKDIADKLSLTVLTGDNSLNKEVKGVYVCDLLSWVMSHAQKGDVWITVHTNLNIVAVSVLVEASCIIVPENIKLEENTLSRADKEGVIILSAKITGYELCYGIYNLIGRV